MQAEAATHDTPKRLLLAAGLFTLGTIDHLAPFHDSISVSPPPVVVVESPTAVQAVADTHDTAERSPPARPLFGLGTIDHLVPFHDSTSVLPVRVRRPTAVQSVADTHD